MKIETPYIREARNPELSRFQLTREETNYSDYDIFVLPINLYPFVRKDLIIDITEGPLLSSEGNEGSEGEEEENRQDRVEDYITRYYVEITDEDGEEPVMTEEEIEDLKDYVDMVCADQSNLVFITSYDNQFYTEEKELIPKEWVNAMLPFLPPFHLGNRGGRKAELKDTGLYVFIHPEEDVYKIYHYYQDFLQQWLMSKYKHGFLPSTYTDTFVKDWGLVKQDGLLRVNKRNPLVFGENPVEFFHHRVSVYEKGDFSSQGFYVGNNEFHKGMEGGMEGSGKKYVWTTPSYLPRMKKVMATLLTVHRYIFTVDQNRFHVVVSGYEEANSLCNSALRKMSWDENQLEKMNGVDIEVPYENPYQPTITF